MSRPAEGSRWMSPEDWTPRRGPQIYVIGPESDDRGGVGLVAAVTTMAYTTRDQFGWPVRHPKGERTFIRLEDFGVRFLPAGPA